MSAIGITMTNISLSVGSTDSNDSSTDINYIGDIAVSPGVGFSYSLSSPTDELGGSISYSASVNYGGFPLA